MKKLWALLKDAYYNKMSNHHFLKYMEYRDKLLATRIENEVLDITPKRPNAIHQELKQMSKDLDRREATELNQLLRQVLEEEEVTRWN